MIVLIGNYAPDHQASMERFAGLLRQELEDRGEQVRMVRPPVVFGGRGGKWTGYMDKFLLGGFWLRRGVRACTRKSGDQRAVVHICDHSNAVYAPWLARKGSVLTVTCHDLLAVRGALGEDTGCPASRLGRCLQNGVLAGLRRAVHVFCDSAATRADLRRLVPSMTPRSAVVALSLPETFRPATPDEMDRTFRGTGLEAWRHRYLLHVGSGQPRKNRAAILRLVATTGNAALAAVFVGEPLRHEERRVAEECGVTDRLRVLVDVSDDQLRAIYSGARALVFPSFHEGYGWPVAEAQACGCPVICTNRSSPPEVAGAAALFAAPDDLSAMQDALMALEQPGLREDLVRKGLDNAKRFQSRAMSLSYLETWQELNKPA